MMKEDLFQWAGLFLALLGNAVGYGKMKQKVETLEKAQEDDADRFLRRDSFDPFAAEVLRRLERIERKQDDHLNGAAH